MPGSRSNGTPVWARLAALACLLVGSPAVAQVPPAIERVILAGGHTVDGKAMAALYGPLQERAPYRGISVVRGVSYGPDPQQVADIFVDKRRVRRGRPILIFVHGGGFTAGARRLQPDSPFYDNVALWAARQGFVAINIDYRLAPAATWPAAGQDVAAAVEWASEHARSYGGDPQKVFLMGHSAGATHVASYAADRSLWGGDRPAVRGLIIVSGSFTVESADAAAPADKPLLARAKAYFGDDPQKFAAQSSLDGLLASGVPLLLVNAELDPDYFLRQRQLLLSAATPGRSRSIHAVLLRGHNHMSEIFSVNSPDTSLTREILNFVRRNPPSR